MDKDKLFLVIYLNIASIPSQDVVEYINKVTEVIKFDDSVLRLIVPVRGEETKIECINPVLLTEEQYKDAEEKINTLKQVVEEKLKTL
jgi:hypothetical protein